MWLELRDKSIRTEADAEAALELPLLVAVPWVGIDGARNGNGKAGLLEPEKADRTRTSQGLKARYGWRVSAAAPG
jgi:hypothetical protein